MMFRTVPLLCLVLILLAPAARGEDQTAPLTITLPASLELAKLTDLTAQFADVSMQYNPQKLNGTVRLSVRGPVTQGELWDILNQVLVSQGFTTVLAGMPPVYQVVPIAEAAGMSVSLGEEDLKHLRFPPGYAVVVHRLTHLTAEPAVKALGTLFTSQGGQIRTLGIEDRRIVLCAPRVMIGEAERILRLIDRPGLTPVSRLFKPLRASAQSIQASATAAWTAMGKAGASSRPVEIQVAPDAVQLLLIASQEDAEELDRLVQELDRSEPVETRSYRPRYFSIDEVGNLLQQLLHGPQGATSTSLDLVRDKLTSSLIVKATVEQHRRIEELLKNLDEAPPTARRRMRSFIVRHRQADEVAKVLGGLLQANPGGGGAPARTTASEPPAPTVPATTPPPSTGGLTTVGVTDSPVTLMADTITNTLIVTGDPKALDQIDSLLKRLDQRQPQVDLEVILVALSSSENLDLGVELMKAIATGRASGQVQSLFGLGRPVPGDATGRRLPDNASGLGGVVLNPGDFTAVVSALQTIVDGRAVIRSQIVVNNNAKAAINGVVQEPLTSINSNSTVATTTISGTTDAGTQITISPQISAADYVTLNYKITQSSFLGQPTITDSGTVIPPTRRSDSVESVASIPDGFIIALGGLSNRNRNSSESRVPLLGGVPLIGNLFKSRSRSDSDSRFYVFIRASILRHASFADLRHRSGAAIRAATPGEPDMPALEPQLMK